MRPNSIPDLIKVVPPPVESTAALSSWHMKRMPHFFLSAALTAVVVLVCGCDRAKPTTDPSPRWIDPTKLAAGSVRHQNLREEQLERIRQVQKTFSEVDPSPVEKWEDDFKRDLDPERELRIWEEMATAFATFTASKNLTLDEKKEAFQIVLLRSGAPDDEVLKHLELKFLTEKDAREIMALFTSKPEPIRVGSPWPF